MMTLSERHTIQDLMLSEVVKRGGLASYAEDQRWLIAEFPDREIAAQFAKDCEANGLSTDNCDEGLNFVVTQHFRRIS